MAKPIGTRPIPWLADRDRNLQQFYEEVKFRLDNLPEGTTGEISSLTNRGVASSPISAYKVLTTDSTGGLIYADSSILSHSDRILGISLTSALAGDTVSYVHIGEVENLGWTWIPESPLFLGLNGNLTTNPSTGVFQARLGYAKTETLIHVQAGLSISFAL